MNRRCFFGALTLSAAAVVDLFYSSRKPGLSCKRDLAAEKRLRDELEIDFTHSHYSEGDIIVRVGSAGEQEYLAMRGTRFIPCDGRHGTPDLRARPSQHTHDMTAWDEEA